MRPASQVKLGAFLPHRRSATTWTSSRTSPYAGRASIANVLRSFGEPADTEKKVLAHTTKCWSGICFFGLEAKDLVLVLDVNEKFKPWLVERSRLYNAMNTLDGDKTRGLLRIE
jgi:hypothetical protein